MIVGNGGLAEVDAHHLGRYGLSAACLANANDGVGLQYGGGVQNLPGGQAEHRGNLLLGQHPVTDGVGESHHGLSRGVHGGAAKGIKAGYE